MRPHPESLDGRPPPKRYRWWRFIEHSLPIIVIYLMVATLVELPDRAERHRDGADRPRRHPVEALPRRHPARPAPAKDEGMRVLLPWDKLFLYDLRLQTYDRHLQRHLQGRRQSDRHDQHPVPAEARRRAATASDDRAGLRASGCSARDRQPGARDFRRIHGRGNLLDQAPGDSEEDPHPHRGDARPEHDAADRGRKANTASITRYRCDELLDIYDTLVLGLELPATVNAAINRKIEQYYLVQEYGFRVEREKKESERKQIEAYGIRDFQQTVTQGISDSYVRWRGIEATLQLAQSPNTKIVIIGSGKDGLPVILGNVDTPVQPNPAAPGTTPAQPARACPTTAKRPSSGRRPRARRSWKRPRPAICRARPNGSRRPRCRARHRTSRRARPRPTRRTRAPSRRPTKRRRPSPLRKRQLRPRSRAPPGPGPSCRS